MSSGGPALRGLGWGTGQGPNIQTGASSVPTAEMGAAEAQGGRAACPWQGEARNWVSGRKRVASIRTWGSEGQSGIVTAEARKPRCGGEEEEELASGEGVSGGRSGTCKGSGARQSTKNSEKCHRAGAEERGAEGRPFPRRPPMGRQSQGGVPSRGFLHTFICSLFNSY